MQIRLLGRHIHFTVLETAKANSLNPEAYLNHLLTVLPDRFTADPKASVDDLMLWAEEMQKLFRTADTEHCIHQMIKRQAFS